MDKEQSLEKISSLLDGIKNKRRTVEIQTNALKEFNMKMEVLLECFKAYSIENKDTNINLSNNTRIESTGVNTNVSNGTNIGASTSTGVNVSKGVSNGTNIGVSISNNTNITKNTGKNTTNTTNTNTNTNNINDIAGESKKIKPNLPFDSLDPSLNEVALKMFQFIENKGTATLDEIVKSVKCSKYKIIEILNIFIKEKVVVKSFDKGFIYKICS